MRSIGERRRSGSIDREIRNILEYPLTCMSKPDNVLDPVVEGIETYMTYTDLHAAWEEVGEINEHSGARFVPVVVH